MGGERKLAGMIMRGSPGLMFAVTACFLLPGSAQAIDSVAAKSEARPSAFDGVWKVVWPCSKEPPEWRKFCASRTPNQFELTLWSTNRNLCGTHASVARFGNRVDEVEDWGPSIVGQMTGKEIAVQFRSHWGATGHAKLRLEGGRLHWKLLDASSSDHWFPEDVVLRRQSKVAAWKTPTGLVFPPQCAGTLAEGV